MTSTRVFFSILFVSALVLFGSPFLRGDVQQTSSQPLTTEMVTRKLTLTIAQIEAKERNFRWKRGE